jgi:hypothetical protein
MISVIFGTLAAIIYSLRVLVLMERRIARIEIHIENLTSKILSYEVKIEKEEEELEKKILKKAPKRKKK